MAYSTGLQQCAMGGSCKQSAVFKCQGCESIYCFNHAADHRRKLGEEMNVIISEYDHLKNIFTQCTSNPNLHPSIKQINDWEKESTEKIQKRANELREQLRQLVPTQINELSKSFEPVSEQLNKGRESDDFIEPDLKLWKETLALIKNNFISQLNFAITQNDENPLVRNTSVVLKTTTERFDRIFDNKVRILENGTVVIRDGPGAWADIRGKNEYSSGCHKIRLRIESETSIYMFLGINSKETVLQSDSYIAKSAYLWQSDGRAWLNGSHQGNHPIQMKQNDIITLIFDCDNKKISIINESTNLKHELTVDIHNCPFPWQLHVNMQYAGEKVRILPF